MKIEFSCVNCAKAGKFVIQVGERLTRLKISQMESYFSKHDLEKSIRVSLQKEPKRTKNAKRD